MEALSKYQLTLDTDDNRINSSPNVIVLPSGQQFAFYSKFLYTGKLSYSRITFTSPSFTVNVEAGNGNINGVAVSWGAGTVTATPNTTQVVYVTNTGVLGIGTNLSMTFLKDVVLLAYLSSGNTSITRINELEHTGNYIYVRKQTLIGSTWIWEDYENLLNTGTDPSCFYNSVTGFIYLYYTKDSATYIRIFDPSDELTWETLSNINITSQTITLNRDPENSIAVVGANSGYKAIATIANNEYPLSLSGFTFVNGQIYVFLPVLSGDYLAYLRSDITYEFFTYSGGTYTLEALYTLDMKKKTSLLFSERYRLWEGTLGVKYVGVRLSTGIFGNEFVTSPTYYSSFEIYPYPDKTILTDPEHYTTDTRDKMLFGVVSSGYKSLVVKTAEYQETKDFESDNGDTTISSGYKSLVLKTAGYQETKDYEFDSGDIAISSGYIAKVVITNS